LPMSHGEGKQRVVDIPHPPQTPKRPVTDIVHGVTIPDPYRWLEDGNSPETLEWTEAQNKRTETVLSQLPEREFLRKRFLEIIQEDTVGSPALRGDRLFYTVRRKGTKQPVLCVRGIDGTSSERVLVDPNEASAKGIVALDWWYPSPDGKMLAYGFSERGDEWSVLHILDVETQTVLPDVIERTRYSGVAWKKDNRSFYYGRYPKSGEVPPGEENYHRHIFHHTLGEDPARDPKVFGEGLPKHDMPGASLSDDGAYLLITVSHGWNSTDVYVRDETRPGSPFITIVQGEDAIFESTIVGDTLYMLTNYKAPRYRLLAVDLKRPERENWKEVIPEDPEFTLTSFEIIKGHIVISALKNAISHLFLYDLNGENRREVQLPFLGTVGRITGNPSSPRFFFTCESFAVAPAIYSYDAEKDGVPRLFLSSTQPVPAHSIEVKQVFYPSKDGTRIPMFILHKEGLQPGTQGPMPTVLSGYGGFNISRTPTYSPTIIPWLEKGGVYASANLRGGSEYGEEWHRAGMLDKKQNVFDDFVAAGEYLIAQGYTDENHLCISGRSNGGLLVGAALTQRPDLFKAVACGVPLLDMIRYHRFLIAYLWTTEYGNPDDPEAFRWLYAYSPYHRVREGVSYPAIYIYTATSDTRVDPMHARKMTAILQDVSSRCPSKGPLLLQVESEAGHGVGKPVHKVVEEQANIWAFLAWQVGLALVDA